MPVTVIVMSATLQKLSKPKGRACFRFKELVCYPNPDQINISDYLLQLADGLTGPSDIQVPYLDTIRMTRAE